MTTALRKYLARRATVRPIAALAESAEPFRQAVVIPALAEAESLPATLASLARNPAAWLAETLVLVVVNNRAGNAGAAVDRSRLATAVEENRRTLAWLARHAHGDGLRLAWIDASSPGRELPAWGGVGLARKIGCDSVLAHLGTATAPAGSALAEFVFLCLDADTLVEPEYLPTVGCGLRNSGRAGATVRVRHQPAESATLQAAIDQYESFLEYYVTGLRQAGSPYAFLTIGSAMAFTAAAYVAAAGFPARRQAGEDFYFLQQLWKVGGIAEIAATTVHPSPRPSWRVPFGTGPRMAEALASAGAGADAEFATYDPRVFAALRDLLARVTTGWDRNASALLASLAEPEVANFLEANDFRTVWSGFQRQHRTADARLYAFHCWFDGFRTLKLIHHLTDRQWPKVPLSTAWAGVNPEP